MVKLIIFAILIAVVISAFTLDLGFVLEGIQIIIDNLSNIPQYLNLTREMLISILNAPTIRIILLFGLGFLILKWLLGLVGDNDEEHKYK